MASTTRSLSGFGSVPPNGCTRSEQPRRFPGDDAAPDGQLPITLHCEQRLARGGPGMNRLRRASTPPFEAVAKGGDPIGTNFGPAHDLMRFGQGTFPIRGHMLRCLLACILFACAGSAVAEERLRVGSKRFTESYILAQVLAQSASPHAATEVKQGLGNTAIVYEALRSGGIDLYPE